MKERIIAGLVNIVSVMDIIILRLGNRTHNEQSGETVLVRLDAIGDFVMWLDSAKEFAKHKEGKLILVCNKVCVRIAEHTGIFDKIIGLDFGKLRHTSKIGYRWSVRKILTGLKAKQVIQVTYSKMIFSDFVVSAINSNEKISIDSPKNIEHSWSYKLAAPIYTHIIETPKENVMEVHRNAIFTKKVLGIEFSSSISQISPSEVKQGVIPEKPYFIVFPGASDEERRWPIDRFAKVADSIYERTGWTCLICGSKEEENLYYKFQNIFSYPEKVLNYMGRTSLIELIEVIRHAQFIISNDTSAIHFAAATDTPSVCVFGVWEYGRFLPYAVENITDRIPPKVLFGESPCKNCLLDGRIKTQDCLNRIKENGTRLCLYDLLAEDVISVLEEEIIGKMQ